MTPLSWYSSANQSTTPHRSFKSANCFSIFASFELWSESSSTSLANLCNSSASISPTVASLFSYGGTKSLPVNFLTSSQCRGLIDGWTTVAINGTVLTKSLMISFSVRNASFLRTSRDNFLIFFCIALAVSSISSASNPSRSNNDDSSCALFTSSRTSQRTIMASAISSNMSSSF